MKARLYLLVILFLLTSVVGVHAQTATPESRRGQQNSSPDVVISFPDPVSEVTGLLTVVGTAAVENMAYYYVEYAALNRLFRVPVSATFIPATAAMTEPVKNGVLAVLNTANVEDGLYALRLTATTTDGQVFYAVVSPLRIRNSRSNLPKTATPPPTLAPSATPLPSAPTPTYDPAPRVIAGANGTNVRYCDVADNALCPVLAMLLPGSVAPVLAISANGSGWFQIRVPNSSIVGWVSPTAVTAAGNISGVPQVMPPAPLPPPVPTAVPATATPVPPPLPTVPPSISQPIYVEPGGSFVLNGISLAPAQPVCLQNFTVQVNAANLGTADTAPTQIVIQDIHVATGTVTASATANVPLLGPGANYVATATLNVSAYFNEQHTVRASGGTQVISTSYTLAQGSCS